MPMHHDAQTVRQCLNKILYRYGINEDDIFAYLTDNGSNVIKAFEDDIQGILYRIMRKIHIYLY